MSYLYSKKEKTMKENILFIHTPMPELGICAISVCGNFYADAFTASDKYNVLAFTVVSSEEVFKLYETYQPKIIFYHYGERTTLWMKDKAWKKKINCKHVVLDTDSRQRSVNDFSPEKFHDFDYYISVDPTVDIEHVPKVFKLNFLRPEVVAPEYVDTGITKIGFHGGAYPNKGIFELPDYIQQNFDEAEIHFHCSMGFVNSGHTDKQLMKNLDIVKSKIYKPGIKFFLTTDIISDQELINRLSQNTINCYLYRPDPYGQSGSSIQAALSARRPIAIRKTKPTLSYWNVNPSICIEENSIKDIIKNGFEPLEPIYQKFSYANVCKEFEEIVAKILKPSGFYFSI
jgi:hypothetical protein